MKISFREIHRAPKALIQEIERKNHWAEVPEMDIAFMLAMKSMGVIALYAAPTKAENAVTYLVWTDRTAQEDNHPPVAKIVVLNKGERTMCFLRTEEPVPNKVMEIHDGSIG